MFSFTVNIHTQIFSSLIESQAQIFVDPTIYPLINTLHNSKQIHLFHTMDALETKLKESSPNQTTIISFSSDKHLKRISELALQYKALTFLDNTTSFGTTGKYNLGIAAQNSSVDLALGHIYNERSPLATYIASTTSLHHFFELFPLSSTKKNHYLQHTWAVYELSLNYSLTWTQKLLYIQELVTLLTEGLSHHSIEYISNNRGIIQIHFTSKKRRESCRMYLLKHFIYSVAPSYEDHLLTLYLNEAHSREDCNNLLKHLSKNYHLPRLEKL